MSPPTDEVDSLTSIEVRLVLVRRRTVKDDGALLVDVVVEVAVRRETQGTIPLGITRRDQRGVHVAVAVEVFPDMSSDVTRRLQPYRQRVGVVEPAVPTAGRSVALDPVVMGVLPGQKGGPRRAAERIGDHIVAK